MSDERRTEDGGRKTEGTAAGMVARADYVVCETATGRYVKTWRSGSGGRHDLGGFRLIGHVEHPSRFTRSDALAIALAAGLVFGTEFAVEEAG